MRLAVSAVVMLLALSACNSPSREFLAAQAANRTTTVPANSTGSAEPEAVQSEEAPAPDMTLATQPASPSPSPTVGVAGQSPITTVATAKTAQATTTTTVAVLEVDPQEVESALAELDELLSSLGSALSFIDQAFEQGE